MVLYCAGIPILVFGIFTHLRGISNQIHSYSHRPLRYRRDRYSPRKSCGLWSWDLSCVLDAQFLGHDSTGISMRECCYGRWSPVDGFVVDILGHHERFYELLRYQYFTWVLLLGLRLAFAPRWVNHSISRRQLYKLKKTNST
jgi:hypothetical protein